MLVLGAKKSRRAESYEEPETVTKPLRGFHRLKTFFYKKRNRYETVTGGYEGLKGLNENDECC